MAQERAGGLTQGRVHWWALSSRDVDEFMACQSRGEMEQHAMVPPPPHVLCLSFAVEKL